MLHALQARKTGREDNTWARRLTGRLLYPDKGLLATTELAMKEESSGQGGTIESVL